MVAALAVVVSLVYVALQIRAQNRESRIASVHELTEAYREAILSFQDANVAAVFARGKSNFEALSETERLQFISLVHSMFRVWEDAFHQYRGRRLDERVWKAMVVQFSSYLSLPGVVRVWEIRKDAFSTDFRDFVDGTSPRDYLTA